MRNPICRKHEAYIWGVLQGAALGKVLGHERILVIEFGVAGGRGLLPMERAAELVEAMVSMGTDVCGFDAGRKRPKPEGYRDLPQSILHILRWVVSLGQERTEKRLLRARLTLRLVKQSVSDFLARWLSACTARPRVRLRYSK